MPFANHNIVPKLARLNFTPPKHNDRTSYFQQYLRGIKHNTTRLKRSDSTETIPDNSDRSYKSRCSSIDDIVEYSMKPEFQIEQQLYNELREQVNSCQNPATDDYDMYNTPNSIEPTASYTSTIGSIGLKGGLSSLEIKRKPSKKSIFESSYCSNNNFPNNKSICILNKNNTNNSININNNSNDNANKINVACGRIIGGRRPLPESNNIKSKSTISKRRLDYSKTISIRNQKIISSRKEKNKMSRIEIQATTKTKDVMSTKKMRNKNIEIVDGGGGVGCRKKFHKYNDFCRRNANNAKIFNQEKLRKELKYLRDRHLSDAVLANEIRKMTLDS